MKSRIEDVPKLKTEPSNIDSQLYNRTRLALLRLEDPLRLRLPGLRGMDILLDSQAWVCVDRTLYDLPVLAWTDFEHAKRDSLHAPVRCMLHYYHIHADLIGDTILETVNRELVKSLRLYRDEQSDEYGRSDNNVTRLNGRD